MSNKKFKLYIQDVRCQYCAKLMGFAPYSRDDYNCIECTVERMDDILLVVEAAIAVSKSDIPFGTHSEALAILSDRVEALQQRNQTVMD